MSLGLAVCVLTACSSSSSDVTSTGSGSSGTGDAAAVAAAQRRLEPYLNPVDKIEVSTPLTRKPDAGKSVYYIHYNLPIAAELDAPFVEATKALGWKGTVLAVDASDPQSVPNAMIRAVSQGANYIAVNSGSIPGMGPGLEAAKKAGVPVFLAAGVGEPGGATNGVYGNTQANTTQVANLRLLDKMIVDSKGSGSALFVNAPDYPLLTPLDAQMKKFVADNCSGCSLATRDISAADLGGDVASGTVAAIRQNPKIKYVVASFDALVSGLPEALKAAGLADVQIFICTPTSASVQIIAKGGYAAGVLPPDEDRTWLLIDQIARQSVGMDVDQKSHGDMYMRLWTTNSVPKGVTGWDPTNFKEQYEALWQVS
ncbi:substrate-binding domain-containing protein [Parafrankia sp. EUN1f]|uniref:substrate-binding domain-containing protein n=1 Tax=Parafrankia sp. EUN1f TaxID=102897 RepID=UPI0003064464|nr:substrate-binding domain-containing protein [Parafrankia sp. EUN1f]